MSYDCQNTLAEVTVVIFTQPVRLITENSENCSGMSNSKKLRNGKLFNKKHIGLGDCRLSYISGYYRVQTSDRTLI